MQTDIKGVDIFSKTLKALMKDRDISAASICAATGIPKSSLSEWLAGRQPKLDQNVVNLAKYLGVSVEYLVTGQHPEETIVTKMIDDMENGFVSIHQGIYRISVEKMTKKPSGKKDGGK